MVRRKTNQTSYYFKNYLVTIKRIQNDINGNARFDAIITNLDDLNVCSRGTAAYNYTFNCYFSADADAAKHILEYHINNTLKTK